MEDCSPEVDRSRQVDQLWEIDWLWSVPLIVATVVMHVVGMMLMYRGAYRVMNRAVARRLFVRGFTLTMAVTALLATIPVSYTHLDVYKRQFFFFFFYTSRCV